MSFKCSLVAPKERPLVEYFGHEKCKIQFNGQRTCITTPLNDISLEIKRVEKTIVYSKKELFSCSKTLK